MPTNCCVKGCHNRSGKDKVKFHRFPNDPILKKQWLKNLNLKLIPTYHRVCSIHFPPDSLHESGRVKEQSIPQTSVMHNYDSLENSMIRELFIETVEVQNENSSNQMKNMKRKRQVKNKVVKPSEVLQLKKKLKTVQQKLRRTKKKLAAVTSHVGS